MHILCIHISSCLCLNKHLFVLVWLIYVGRFSCCVLIYKLGQTFLFWVDYPSLFLFLKEENKAHNFLGGRGGRISKWYWEDWHSNNGPQVCLVSEFKSNPNLWDYRLSPNTFAERQCCSSQRILWLYRISSYVCWTTQLVSALKQQQQRGRNMPKSECRWSQKQVEKPFPLKSADGY